MSPARWPAGGMLLTALAMTSCGSTAVSPRASDLATQVTTMVACDAASQPEDVPDIVLDYASLWSMPDAAERLEILEAVWVQDGSYVDPLLDEPVTGIEAFNRYLDGFTGAYPGYYFTVRAWERGDFHHDRLRMRWHFCSPDGESLVEGTDFGILAADGRFQSVTVFFPLPWPDSPAP